MESGQVDGRGLLVTGDDAAPLLQAVDAPLDGVALLVGLAVESRWPAAPAFPPQSVTSLVGRDGDHRPDTALAQVAADRAGGTCLVGHDHVRPGAGSSTAAGNAQACHHFHEGGRVAARPAVRWKTNGRQHLSVARWIFVVSPPRDRPMAWSSGSPAGAPFCGPQSVLVSPHDRGIHRNGLAELLVRVGLGHQGGEHPLPGAINGPRPQPVVDTSSVAVLLRHMNAPGTSLKPGGDGVDHLTMVPPAATPPPHTGGLPTIKAGPR